MRALKDQDRSTLLLAGFWLEHQIIATALHALADAYDVYALIDASPARALAAEQPTRNGLRKPVRLLSSHRKSFMNGLLNYPTHLHASRCSPFWTA